MFTRIVYTMQKIYMLIFPPVCAFCAFILKENTVICINCKDTIQFVATIPLSITDTHVVPVHAVGSYTGHLQQLVRAKNYRNIHASWQLGSLIWQYTDIKQLPVDYWVPIPLHWTRTIHRGFNQAYEIAKILHEKSGKPVCSLLKRKRRTIFQSRLNKKERIDNVKDVFEIIKQMSLKNKHIVIVDDLLTSGATIQQAVKEIRKLQPASIRIVVACRIV